ncbi:MAG: DEAD/DEAH box helicase [Spirochaetales bacterium]|nr:MAG: DEAD/DEAH box helicase [Spirochaetales bacterium]
MPLEYFHPLLREWFSGRFPGPTEVQELAWQEIIRGSHVLVTAPTGSGKTLTAFLWALDRLITGAWEAGSLRVLYISPLKALNNDIQANLMEPLAELRELFLSRRQPFPALEVMVRSGDTPGPERQRMLKKPPEILITTPESLNILLSSKRALSILTDLKTVILDEIHAVAGSKRGVHLMTAVERLTLLSGEFQRLGVSATVRPLDAVAGFMGGREQTAPGIYRNRRVSIIDVRGSKEYDVIIAAPRMDAPVKSAPPVNNTPPGGPAGDSFWEPYVGEFRRIIRKNRTTLFFVPSRRHAEKLAFLINRDEPSLLAYAHHGSLSRELRHYVEERLKSGDLPAIVATGSLELGIDIGHLDEVVLVKTPWTVASAMQRIGRAGHRVGDKSRARFYPAGGLDSLKAAVMYTAVLEKDIEEIVPVREPLDVLAQIIVSMTGTAVWETGELYDFIRTCSGFSGLTRRHFDLVLNMLAGKYASSTQKVLEPRLFVDSLTGTVKGKEGILTLLYHSGGTIPDRGYFDLRMSTDGSKIGELDEEFVWERKTGDTFAMGTQLWTIMDIGARDVKVIPGAPSPQIIPFWKAENQWSGFHFAGRLLAFCETWTGRTGSAEFFHYLSEDCRMEPKAAEDLIVFLRNQEDHTGLPLPHRHQAVFEYVNEGTGLPDTRTSVLHTLWGGRVNHPFGLVFSSVWEEKFGYPLEVYADNECILFHLPHTVSEEALPRMIAGEMPLRYEDIAARLKTKLEGTEFFGARFRENAARALLLPRGGFGRRQPLWLTRLKSKKLFAAVKKFEDFPITVETWRTCLKDEFDLDSLALVTAEIKKGLIALSQCWTSSPSPFARNILWYRTNLYMYQTDEPFADGTSSLSDSLIRDLMAGSGDRMRISGELAAEVQMKLQRTWEGYAPESWEDLVSFTERRVFIPEPEWQSLLRAMERDHNLTAAQVMEHAGPRLVRLRSPGMEGPVICHAAAAAVLMKLFAMPAEQTLLEAPAAGTPVNFRELPGGAREEPFSSRGEAIAAWLGFYGPLPVSQVGRVFGIGTAEGDAWADLFSEDDQFIVGTLMEGSEESCICDADNWERLLYLKRRQFRFTGAPKKPEFISPFLMDYQRLGCGGTGLETLESVMDQLAGYPAPAGLWEEEFLPARIAGYRTAWLDQLFRASDLCWFGTGRGAVSFSLRSNLDLYLETGAPKKDLLPDRRGKFDLWAVKEHLGLSSAETVKALWKGSWQGDLATDTFETVRKGILNRFRAETFSAAAAEERPPGPKPGRRHSLRSGSMVRLPAWKAGRDDKSHWFSLAAAKAPPVAGDSPLEEQELLKDRARQLLLRYGLLFRELLERELPVFRWKTMFSVLRLMEFSGEAVSGRFFEGISGVQFLHPDALGLLSAEGTEIRWMNACDPASPCGLGLKGLPYTLPARLPSNHLVFRGRELMFVSQRKGRHLTFFCNPEDQGVDGALGFFDALLSREFNPPGKIIVETVNGIPVRESPYGSCLVTAGFKAGFGSFTLYSPGF